MKNSDSPLALEAPRNQVDQPPKETSAKRYIVVIGSIRDGYEFIGPFNSSEELIAFTKQNNINDCEWAMLRSPEEKSRGF